MLCLSHVSGFELYPRRVPLCIMNRYAQKLTETRLRYISTKY